MSFMPTNHYKAGQVIFEEGYPPDGVYLICSGRVKIVKNRSGKEVGLAELGEGSVFGEMAFIDERPRSATVVAVDDTWCYKHNNASFLAKIKGLDPTLAKLFQDLVDVIREKSKAMVLIDHSSIYPLYDTNNYNTSGVGCETITPSRPKEELLADKKVQDKVAKMDLFMRTLFASLVNIAYMQ